MFAPLSFGTTNYEERIARRDGAWTVLHRHAAPGPEAPVWKPSARSSGAPVEATPLDGALTRRAFPFARVPQGGDPVADRHPVLFNDHVVLSWLCADSASPTTVFTDHDGDQLVCVIEGGATLDTPCGALRVNPAEHVFIPGGIAHRWKVDKLGLRALVLEVRGELAVPRAWRNDYGQLSPEAPFGRRDLNLPNWFMRPHGLAQPAAGTLRRGGERYDGSYTNDPMSTVGWEGSIYPASIAWESALIRPMPHGAVLFEHERFVVRTCITRDDGPPPPGLYELATLALDGDGAASLGWEPLGVPPRPAGTLGGIAVQVCALDALKLAPDGALLMER